MVHLVLIILVINMKDQGIDDLEDSWHEMVTKPYHYAQRFDKDGLIWAETTSLGLVSCGDIPVRFAMLLNNNAL